MHTVMRERMRKFQDDTSHNLNAALDNGSQLEALVAIGHTINVLCAAVVAMEQRQARRGRPAETTDPALVALLDRLIYEQTRPRGLMALWYRVRSWFR